MSARSTLVATGNRNKIVFIHARSYEVHFVNGTGDIYFHIQNITCDPNRTE